ncbi:hypothetical protein DAETH_37720 (plasmid) [Deinococcus aetherius]|uniref:Uncharacterized protein n=1 Tax=Deinococcus aetherius TaxID=200252 RepID=A0ABN6RM32_9DEIO|nr:hypothetical protein [Deinococcus aetherius]BDP43803.1 hypothetical protein DAETH_37720 [Deinococcus aetherius]
MQEASRTNPANPLDPRRTYRSQEFLKLVKTHPERAKKVVASGMTLQISAQQVAGLDTLLDRAVDEQGTVETSAMEPFEITMLIVAVATLVATVYGATKSGGDGTTVTVTVTGDGDVNVNTGGGGEGHGDGGGENGGDGGGDTGGGG